MLQQKGRRLVKVPRDTKVALIKNDDDIELITIMSCIVAIGDAMTQIFIFPLKNTPNELDDLVVVEKFNVADQQEGWISQEIFGKWIDLFIE